MIIKITDPFKMPITINCNSAELKTIQDYLDRSQYGEYLELFLYDLNGELEESRMLRYVDGKGYCVIEYPGLTDYQNVLQGYKFKPEDYYPVEQYIELNKILFKTGKIKNMKGISLINLHN